MNTEYNTNEKQILTGLLALVSKDGEEAAELLFRRYNGLREILEADLYSLSDVLGKHKKFASYIQIAVALVSRSVTDKFKFGKKHTIDEITDYFKALFLGLPVETVYIMSFDKERRIIACDYAGEGTVNFSSVFPRKLLEIAIKRKAASIIIAHNHPGGYAKPSAEDEESTEALSHLFSASGISLDAHYVIAGTDAYRMEEQPEQERINE